MKSQLLLKRGFDILGSFVGLFIVLPVILLAIIVASVDTHSFGLFYQKRMGKDFKEFTLFKIKTMRQNPQYETFITTTNDPRITRSGHFFRKYKIDELPQLWNVLIGQMSFVGPRPDVSAMFQNLSDEERQVLSIRPGITGPATLKYRKEEEILAQVENKEKMNQEIFQDKIKINIDYMREYRFYKDLLYIVKTIF